MLQSLGRATKAVGNAVVRFGSYLDGSSVTQDSPVQHDTTGNHDVVDGDMPVAEQPLLDPDVVLRPNNDLSTRDEGVSPMEEGFGYQLGEEATRASQIGLAFVGGGHAIVVIRTGSQSSAYDIPDLDEPKTLKEDRVLVDIVKGELHPSEKGRLMLLHMRFEFGQETGPVVLALDERPYLRYYRFADLYRLNLSLASIKELARKCRPTTHRILAEDCATFSYRFLCRLIDLMVEQEIISGENGATQKRLLTQHVHVLDGSSGAVEAQSRQHESLAESGHASYASANHSSS